MSKTMIRLLKKGLKDLTKQEMDFFYQECRLSMWEYQELPDDIFDVVMADLKLYDRAKKRNLRDVSDFCNSVWWLHKNTDLDLIKIHKQFRAMVNCKVPFWGDDAIIGNDRAEIRFYLDYVRYAKANKDAASIGINTDDAKYVCHYWLEDSTGEAGFSKRVAEYECDLLEKSKFSDNILALREKYKGLELSFEHDGEEYLAILPKDCADIINEGHTQRNCMSSRMREYCEGHWLFVFFRKANEPETPIFDAIISRSRRGLEPTWCISKGHEDIEGTPYQGVFAKWWNLTRYERFDIERDAFCQFLYSQYCDNVAV